MSNGTSPTGPAGGHDDGALVNGVGTPIMRCDVSGPGPGKPGSGGIDSGCGRRRVSICVCFSDCAAGGGGNAASGASCPERVCGNAAMPSCVRSGPPAGDGCGVFSGVGIGGGVTPGGGN